MRDLDFPVRDEPPDTCGKDSHPADIALLALTAEKLEADAYPEDRIIQGRDDAVKSFLPEAVQGSRGFPYSRQYDLGSGA